MEKSEKSRQTNLLISFKLLSMANFDEILNELKDKTLELIKSTLLDFKDQAKEDVNEFFNNSKDKLERWTTALAKGELTKDDFKWLLESQKDLLVMNGLKQAGLAKIQIDKLKNAVVNLVVNTIADKVL
jgi:hypothetical protein